MKRVMQYEFRLVALLKMRRFYHNVAKKYHHTYDFNDMQRNIQKAVLNAYLIERTLLRRRPNISRWEQEGWHMANAGKWYYAYTIDDETITIQDACHEQNMHEETE